MRSAHVLYFRGIGVLSLGMACLFAGGSAWGIERVYNLVQNSSTIAISGNVDGNTITSQGTNNFGQSSLVARYAGTIRTDRVVNTANTISFLGGSSIDAQVNGTWQPGVGGVSGSAAADHAGRVVVSGSTVNMAGRGLVADLVTGGSPVSITNGQFSLATTDVDLIGGNVDYRGTIVIIVPITVLDGTYALAGQGGDLSGTASISTQSIGGGMLRETLTIPVNSSLPPVNVSGYNINLTLTGQLVATSDFADSGDRYWITPSANTFSTASNWNPALTPGTTETAVFDLSTNHTVNFSGNATNNRLRVEQDQVTFALGTNTYNLTNTSTTTPSIVVGATSGDSGRVTISGTGAGGTLSSMHAFLGSVASSTGQVTVGAGATWNSSGQLSVGRGGNGSLTINGGGDFVAPAGGITYLGYATGSLGNASISGSGSTMINGQLFVGRQGTGTMSVGSGGMVTSTTARIGSQATGSVTVSGISSFTSTGTLFVGEQAQGTVTIQSGSMLNTATTNIGSNAGSNGTVTITGTNSEWNNTGSVFVGGTSGSAGNLGTLHINSNASVTIGSILRTWAGGTVNLNSGKLTTTSLNIS